MRDDFNELNTALMRRFGETYKESRAVSFYDNFYGDFYVREMFVIDGNDDTE